MKTRIPMFIALCAIFLCGFVSAKDVSKVPPKQFQGIWLVTKVTWKGRHTHEPNAQVVREEKVVAGRQSELRFRMHKSGSLQQVWLAKDTGEVTTSRGITILKLTEDTLKYRLWSEHKDMYRQLKLNTDGTAVLTIFWPKDIESHYLKKNPG